MYYYSPTIAKHKDFNHFSYILHKNVRYTIKVVITNHITSINTDIVGEVNHIKEINICDNEPQFHDILFLFIKNYNVTVQIDCWEINNRVRNLEKAIVQHANTIKYLSQHNINLDKFIKEGKIKSLSLFSAHLLPSSLKDINIDMCLYFDINLLPLDFSRITITLIHYADWKALEIIKWIQENKITDKVTIILTKGTETIIPNTIRIRYID